MQKRPEKCSSGTLRLYRGNRALPARRAGKRLGGGGQRRRMAVEHATQVFAMDRLPGNAREFKQTGVLCLRFQAPVSLRGDLVGQSAEKTRSCRRW